MQALLMKDPQVTGSSPKPFQVSTPLQLHESPLGVGRVASYSMKKMRESFRMSITGDMSYLEHSKEVALTRRMTSLITGDMLSGYGGVSGPFTTGTTESLSLKLLSRTLVNRLKTNEYSVNLLKSDLLVEALIKSGSKNLRYMLSARMLALKRFPTFQGNQMGSLLSQPKLGEQARLLPAPVPALSDEPGPVLPGVISNLRTHFSNPQDQPYFATMYPELIDMQSPIHIEEHETPPYTFEAGTAPLDYMPLLEGGFFRDQRSRMRYLPSLTDTGDVHLRPQLTHLEDDERAMPYRERPLMETTPDYTLVAVDSVPAQEKTRRKNQGFQEETEPASGCYAVAEPEDGFLGSARKYIKQRIEIPVDGHGPATVSLEDYIRDGTVMDGFKLAASITVGSGLDGLYNIEAFNTKTGSVDTFELDAGSAYAQLDQGLRDLGLTSHWENFFYIDTDTGEEKSGLYLKTIKETDREAKSLLGGKDDYGTELSGLIVLINGSEPGNGTTPLHNHPVSAGDVIELVYKNDSGFY